MKKLVSLLASIVLISSSSILLVSCIDQASAVSPLNIGKNIKKVENAVEYKNGTNNSNKNAPFTNYFIVGDSLSDVDGITNMIQEKTKFNIKDLEMEVKLPIGSGFPIKINVNVETDISLTFGEEGTDGYGFADDEGKWHSSFMNGKPAGYILNEKLGFSPINSVSAFSNKLDETMRNYSIGGATATKQLSSIAGLILDDVTVDKQARALVSQHNIEDTKNDIVFFEIGGNDMMALAGVDVNNKALQDKLIKEAASKIKIALFTLLNNGIEKIIVGTAPDITGLPSYKNVVGNEKKHLQELAEKFYSEMTKTINYVESFYENQIQIYDIYKEFDGLKIRHEKRYNEEHKDEPKIVTNKVDEFITRTNIKGEGEVSLTIIKSNGEDGKKISIATLNEDGLVVNKINPIDLLPLLFSKKLRIELKGNAKIIANRDIQDDAKIDRYFFTDTVHPTRIVHELVSEDLVEISKLLE